LITWLFYPSSSPAEVSFQHLTWSCEKLSNDASWRPWIVSAELQLPNRFTKAYKCMVMTLYYLSV